MVGLTTHRPKVLSKRVNQDIKTMLSMWLHDHNTKIWVLGLNLMPLVKITRHHSGIGNDPYTMMYGQQCRLGVFSLPLMPEVITSMGSELDLDRVLNSVRLVDPNQGSQVTTPHSKEVDEAATEVAMAATD
jgi:hypothetical protein